MEQFAVYLFRSVIWLTGFALIYYLFLRNERFFLLIRYYLVAGIIASFILPLVPVHYPVEILSPAVDAAGLITEGSQDIRLPAGEASGSNFDMKLMLMYIYIAGLSVLLFRLLMHIRSLFKSIKKAEIKNIGGFKMVRAPEFSSSFSFINYVFISPSADEDEVKEIMNHELVHVNQRHWFDLLLAEILRVLQWINPFAWIYNGFIRMNHEFLADEAALKRTSDPAVYKAVLMNQLFDTHVFSLSNSFNYSLNKRRFEMMKKIVSSPYRKLRVLSILPVAAGLLFAFATPEYHYIEQTGTPVTIYQASPVIQKVVKGIVVNEEGKPLGNVRVTSTGPMNFASGAETSADGRFALTNVFENGSILFDCKGYLGQSLKPDFSSEMKVVMVKDPEYREPAKKDMQPKPLYVVDGVLSETMPPPEQIATINVMKDPKSVEKYGEKAKNGVIEVITLKKAAEQGIKIPFRRRNPEDYPTFRGERFTAFRSWVMSQVKYPPEATAKNIEGWVQVNFVVEPDGSLSNIKPGGLGNPLLAEAVMQVIRSSPKWEPAKNPAANEPYQSSVTVSFKLPDRIVNDEPFVVVEEMPMYPGGDGALLKFIAENTRYPAEAKRDSIQGRVIVRFVVNTDGNTEGISVLKGVHPLLDNESVRVVSQLTGFKPGMQGGKPVNVWYMVPITFTLK